MGEGLGGVVGGESDVQSRGAREKDDDGIGAGAILLLLCVHVDVCSCIHVHAKDTYKISPYVP